VNIPSAAGRLAPALLLLSLGAIAGPTALAQRATVQVRVDEAPASTRFVLSHSSPVAYEIRRGEGHIVIVYAAPVRPEPKEADLDDTIVYRYAFDGDRRLVLFTGPGFRAFESFELRNPFRIVVDLQGNRGERAVPAVPPELAPVRPADRRIVVIDPGHGGIETGATGPGGMVEKDVTLDLARRLKRALERDRRLEVVLTRDEDRLVGLDERTAIANHNRADLFLSIHMNAASRATAHGAETYFLSADATDDAARTLAALENRGAERGDDVVVTVDGEQRNLQLVLWDLAQNQYLAESSALAESMQRHLNELTGTRDRGVRQAPFRVLMGATMPAVLVEVGFVTNPEEETKFRTDAYREQVVQAMTRAVHEFVEAVDRLSRPASPAAAPGAGAP